MSDSVLAGQHLIALLTLSAMVDAGQADASELRELTEELLSDPNEAALIVAGLLGFIAGLIPNSPEEFIKVMQSIGPTVYDLEEN